MQEVAHSKSGAQGEFTLTIPDSVRKPMLVRAVYHGINFNHAVPPGTTTAQVASMSLPRSKDDQRSFTRGDFQPNGAA